MTTYEEFLQSKRSQTAPVGFDLEGPINEKLFAFQADIVRWALRRGRAAVFADCGLGKTPIQLEWARFVAAHTERSVLILCPLAVAAQTIRQGEKFDVSVTLCRHAGHVQPGVNITNYEMLHHFEPSVFGGIVLDESSILKSFDGVTRKALTEFGREIPFRLCCTATPAPNDLIELTNHAEFLDILTGKEIIALFFTQDGNTTHNWRLKGHARTPFWEWLASWSVALRAPSDLGYADDGFILPALNIHHEIVESKPLPGYLIPTEAQSMRERLAARRESIQARVARTADLVIAMPGPWVVWCNLNAESAALAKAIPDAVEVCGSDDLAKKEAALMGFADGQIRVLVTKPTIAGFGMNWQHCANVAFVGLSDSYEQFYQAIRRCWRFGQTRPVHCHVITAEAEGAVVENIRRKEQQASEMFGKIVQHMRGLQMDQARRSEVAYKEQWASGEGWTLHLGDAINIIPRLAAESVGLSVFSPPFPGMYAYTNSAHDVGNSNSIDELLRHFAFLVPELLRVTLPGRLCCVHLCQITAMQSRDGYIGLKDYRGRVISLFEGAGWIYTGEVTIDKNPQIQATRNKDRGLLFKSLATDSAVLRMALGDYLVYFRKPGENKTAIKAGAVERYNKDGGWITEAEWIEWAAPVWYRQTKDYPGGIRETDVLNVAQARESDDERHLCPLQLGVCERAIKLWSNPGDLVLDPFAGICSVGVKALELGRRFVGIELKRSYWQAAQKNLGRVQAGVKQGELFALRAE